MDLKTNNLNTEKINEEKKEILSPTAIDATTITVIDSEFKDKEKDDDYTPPCIHPAVTNLITMDKFKVEFNAPSFIRSDDIVGVTKPAYNIRKHRYSSRKVLLAFRMIKETVYFGKPTRYTNFISDEELFEKIEEFNEKKYSYMDVIELDSGGNEKIRTRYTAPRIIKVDFSPCDKTYEGLPKYYTAEVRFNDMIQD